MEKLGLIEVKTGLARQVSDVTSTEKLRKFECVEDLV